MSTQPQIKDQAGVTYKYDTTSGDGVTTPLVARQGSNDGDHASLGAKTDPVASDTTTWSAIALLKWIGSSLATLAAAVSGALFQINLSKAGGATLATGHGTASGAIRVELPTDGTGTVSIGSVALSAGGTPTDGTLTATTTGAALGVGTACKMVLVQADPDNTVDVFVGDSSNQRYQFTPGQAEWFAVSNVNLIYAKSASSTAVVNFVSIN